MASSLRFEDRLDGAANFSPWKERIVLLLEEAELWDIVNNTQSNPVIVPTDATLLAAFQKKNVKAKRMILDAIKDHVIPHVAGKANAYEMWASLTKLYQSSNENRKMVLREKLRNIKMTETEKVSSYLTRITQVRDELGAVGEVITDGELVRTTLNGFSEKWNTFVKGVVSRENRPNWERLWDDFIQEETHEEALCSRQSKGEENEENVALVAAKKKDKKSSHGEKKDMSKVRCYACRELGHYAGQCPNKKKKKQEPEVSASTEVVEFTEKFEKEFSLMACLAGIGCLGCTGTLAWFLDSGASRHMTGMRFVFLSFSEIGSGNYVGCGVSTRHVLAVEGVGSVRFQLESGGYLELAEVLYVPELSMNLLSVSSFEIDGCGIVFSQGLAYLYPEGISYDPCVLLGVLSKRLYRVLGQLVVGSSGWLEPESDSGEASERGPWMSRSLDQSSVQVAGDASSSEGAEASSAVGAATAAEDMMGLETDLGGGSRSTSLAKREC
jgi:hypothetical protein